MASESDNSAKTDLDIPKEQKLFLLGPAPKLIDIDSHKCSGTVLMEEVSWSEKSPEPEVPTTLRERVIKVFEGLSTQEYYHYFQIPEIDYVKLWQTFFSKKDVFNSSFPKRLAFRENLRFITNEHFSKAIAAIAYELIELVTNDNKQVILPEEGDRSPQFVTTHVLQQVMRLAQEYGEDTKKLLLERIKIIDSNEEIVRRIKSSADDFEIIFIDDFVLSGWQVVSRFLRRLEIFNTTQPLFLEETDAKRVHFKNHCIAAIPRVSQQKQHTMTIIPAYFLEPYQEAIDHDGMAASNISVFGSWCSTDYGFINFIINNFGPENGPPLLILKGKYEREYVSKSGFKSKQKGSYLDDGLQRQFEEVLATFGNQDQIITNTHTSSNSAL